MATAGEFGTASARTLADILAEAGIEVTGSGGRRRRSEPDLTGTPEVSGPEPGPVVVDSGGAEADGVDSGGAEAAWVDSAEAEAEIDAGEQARTAPAAEPAAVPAGSAARGWSLLLVEVVAAAFLGVLLWYGFSVLWELYPYAAAVAAPVVLAGIVGVGQLLRARRGLPALPGSAVFALLLVGAVLAVLPAAAVLARS